MRVLSIFLLLVCLGACFLKKNISQPPKSTLTAQDSICLEMENIIKSNWMYDSVKKAYIPQRKFWLLMDSAKKYTPCLEKMDTLQGKKLFGEPTDRQKQVFLYALYPPCRDLCDHCRFFGIRHENGKFVRVGLTAFNGICN